jgi:ATP-dependent HslUV protease ATP-binding subunit HslU
MLRDGELDAREIEVEVREPRSATLEIFTPQGNMEGLNIQDMLGGLLGGRPHKRRLPIQEALKLLREEEAHKLVDQDQAKKIGPGTGGTVRDRLPRRAGQSVCPE